MAKHSRRFWGDYAREYQVVYAFLFEICSEWCSWKRVKYLLRGDHARKSMLLYRHKYASVTFFSISSIFIFSIHEVWSTLFYFFTLLTHLLFFILRPTLELGGNCIITTQRITLLFEARYARNMLPLFYYARDYAQDAPDYALFFVMLEIICSRCSRLCSRYAFFNLSFFNLCFSIVYAFRPQICQKLCEHNG